MGYKNTLVPTKKSKIAYAITNMEEVLENFTQG